MKIQQNQKEDERNQGMISLVNFKTGKLISQHSDLFERARKSNPMIDAALKAGRSLEDIVVILDGFINELLQENMRLEGICPRKTRGPDGVVHVWHCPDDEVPMSILNEHGTERKVENEQSGSDSVGI